MPCLLSLHMRWSRYGQKDLTCMSSGRYTPSGLRGWKLMPTNLPPHSSTHSLNGSYNTTYTPASWHTHTHTHSKELSVGLQTCLPLKPNPCVSFPQVSLLTLLHLCCFLQAPHHDGQCNNLHHLQHNLHHLQQTLHTTLASSPKKKKERDQSKFNPIILFNRLQKSIHEKER